MLVPEIKKHPFFQDFPWNFTPPILMKTRRFWPFKGTPIFLFQGYRCRDPHLKSTNKCCFLHSLRTGLSLIVKSKTTFTFSMLLNDVCFNVVLTEFTMTLYLFKLLNIYRHCPFCPNSLYETYPYLQFRRP